MTIAQDLYNEEDSMFCSKKVCVMEAAGQLGSTLVHRLLLRGYTVHAAFQNHGLFLLLLILMGKFGRRVQLKF